MAGSANKAGLWDMGGLMIMSSRASMVRTGVVVPVRA